jgi:hypothetical protein
MDTRFVHKYLECCERCKKKLVAMRSRPDAKQKTRMAVPYEACDLPSLRSEYKHPDSAIILTILSYYQVGLSEKALRDVVKGLNELPEGMRQTKYRCVLPCFPYCVCYVLATDAYTC